MLADYHTHTCLSDDGKGTVEDYCRWAIKNGVDEVCFTNHHEWRSVVDGTYSYAMRREDLKRLMRDVDAAKKKFPDLTLKIGCELGYHPSYIKEIESFASSYPFDFILGSAHYLDGKLMGTFPTPGIDDRAVRKRWYRDYLGVVEELAGLTFFDCLGHLDLIARFQPSLDVQEYADIIRRIAKKLVAHDTGFELNCSGWSYQTKMCYPSPGILRLLFEGGVRKVTLGSDTHEPRTVGKDIDKGKDMLRSIGFSQFCTYTGRKAIFHPL